jgi:hypothetical protein
LDEAEEVLWVILPSDKDATLPLDPCEEALEASAGVHFVWQVCCDCAISDQTFGLGFDQVKIEHS